MSPLSLQFFPALHTAIAEWLFTLLYIVLLPKRRPLGQRMLATGLTLLLFLLVNWFRSQTLQVMWIPLMILSMGMMLALLFYCAQVTFLEAVFYWAYAFITAEFAASLEWNINYYLIISGVISIHQSFICMGIVFALVFALQYFISRRMFVDRHRYTVTRFELASVFSIVVIVFFISNFSYAFPENVFSQSLGAGTLYARTLIDLVGIITLYAISAMRWKMHLNLELEAMSNLLNRQYEQYQRTELNNEALHRIYHDLKHQLEFIRLETDEEKRESYLREIDRVIARHESQVTTGNSVLNVLLSSKNAICVSKGIAMTCFADAKDLAFMDVMDICSIFGNAIDNAIECELEIVEKDKRLIKVTVCTQNSFLLIRIANYCEREVVFDAGLPRSTKPNKQIHGFGVKSIRLAISKYGGHMTMEQEDNWFTLTALIPLPEGQ